MTAKNEQRAWQIVTVNGKGLPIDVDRTSYDTADEALKAAHAYHRGEFRVESYALPELQETGT